MRLFFYVSRRLCHRLWLYTVGLLGLVVCFELCSEWVRMPVGPGLLGLLSLATLSVVHLLGYLWPLTWFFAIFANHGDFHHSRSSLAWQSLGWSPYQYWRSCWLHAGLIAVALLAWQYLLLPRVNHLERVIVQSLLSTMTLDAKPGAFVSFSPNHTTKVSLRFPEKDNPDQRFFTKIDQGENHLFLWSDHVAMTRQSTQWMLDLKAVRGVEVNANSQQFFEADQVNVPLWMPSESHKKRNVDHQTTSSETKVGSYSQSEGTTDTDWLVKSLPALVVLSITLWLTYSLPKPGEQFKQGASFFLGLCLYTSHILMMLWTSRSQWLSVPNLIGVWSCFFCLIHLFFYLGNQLLRHNQWQQGDEGG